jgi:hypothetical protein
MTTLEKATLVAFRAWGPDFAQWTLCRECGEFRYCRARRRHGKWLCLECFDLAGFKA